MDLDASDGGRRCSVCGEHKPSEAFYQKPDGRPVARCKRCASRMHPPLTPERKARMRATRASDGTRLWAEALDAYGSRCSCCGEAIAAFLRVESVAAGSAPVRNRLTLWRMLREAGWPADHELVCGNCSLGKVLGGGFCPHRSGAEWDGVKSGGGEL